MLFRSVTGVQTCALPIFTWSPEDEEFVATCLEFPSLSWLAGTPEDALAGLRELVDEVVADLRESGESVGGRRCAAGTGPGGHR